MNYETLLNNDKKNSLALQNINEDELLSQYLFYQLNYDKRFSILKEKFKKDKNKIKNPNRNEEKIFINELINDDIFRKINEQNNESKDKVIPSKKNIVSEELKERILKSSNYLQNFYNKKNLEYAFEKIKSNPEFKRYMFRKNIYAKNDGNYK